MKFIEKQINIKIKQKFIQHSNYKLHEIFFQKYIYIYERVIITKKKSNEK